MSTYYYICCQAEKVRGPLIVGRSMMGGYWPGDDEAIVDMADFVEAHVSCGDDTQPLAVLSEHAVDDYRNWKDE